MTFRLTFTGKNRKLVVEPWGAEYALVHGANVELEIVAGSGELDVEELDASTTLFCPVGARYRAKVGNIWEPWSGMVPQTP